jgi:predicted ABC-type ATPase
MEMILSFLMPCVNEENPTLLQLTVRLLWLSHNYSMDQHLDKVPIFILLAGINGAGKTSFYEKFLSRKFVDIPFVNADNMVKEKGIDNKEAQEQANELRCQYINKKVSFIAETVFSHKSKIGWLKEAKEAGYYVWLVYIHLDSAELANKRVDFRVQEGGHFVPPERVEKRYNRTVNNIKLALTIPNKVSVFDNSTPEKRFLPLCVIANKPEGVCYKRLLPSNILGEVFLKQLVENIENILNVSDSPPSD